MLRRFIKVGLVFLVALTFLTSCGQASNEQKIKKVGLLVPETVNDQVWGTMGYKGMLRIQSRFDVDVFYKEDIQTDKVIERAVKEFEQKGVNLIFGHGHVYAPVFNEIASQYPDIHFVSFNGDATEDNTTSLNFEGYAMGFFGGMVAAEHSKTGNVGVIGAFEWQPEIQGFSEGARYQNESINVHTKFTSSWDDVDKAVTLLSEMIPTGVDVIYPAGDGYNVPVIEKIKEQGLYAIGYISDQSDLGESTVLTSTVQNVDVLYELIAEKYTMNELKSGNQSFDFQDGVITMGTYSPEVDKDFIEELTKLIDSYKNTGKLPTESK